MIRLVLPWPVSVNRYWRSFVPRGSKRAIVTVSDEAKAYKRQVGWLAKEAGIRLRGGLVQLDMTLIPANGICMDLDNAMKVAIDALNGIAYADDSQVRKIIAERAEPDHPARLEVTISEYVPAIGGLFEGHPALPLDTGSAIAKVSREAERVPF